MDPQSNQPILSNEEGLVSTDRNDLKDSEEQNRNDKIDDKNNNEKVHSIQVWKPSNDSRPPPRPELRDDYFVPTASEAQKAFSGQVNLREKLNDSPLLTKNLRDRELNQKRNEKFSKFPSTRIRIKFSDRTMLEGTFSSSSTISDVYDFVTDCLTEQIRSKKFVLYQTPPRREFLRTDQKVWKSCLLDLQLSPSSLLYIKFSDESLNQTNKRPNILPELLKDSKDLPIPKNEEESEGGGSKSFFGGGGGGRTTSSSSKSSTTKVSDVLKSGAKVPKWLQNMKKK